MPQDAPSTYVLNRKFADVDDLAVEAQQWNLDFQQLDRGGFNGSILQFGVHGTHISDARFGRSLNQKGTPPVGMRTVAVPANPDLRLQWRGKLIDGQSLMVFPLGSELSSVSGPDFHVYTCSFPEELLSRVGETLKVGGVDEIGSGVEALRVGSSAMTKLQSCLRQICQSVRDDPTALSNTSLVSKLTLALPNNLMNAIASGTGKCPSITGPKRLAALTRAEAFIALYACDNIKIADICRAAGVSERTLQYAFVARFGIGPKEFLNAFRLISVRRELRMSDPRTAGVADIANAWGFWHMGQFARDYRERFGELPSQTLRFESSN